MDEQNPPPDTLERLDASSAEATTRNYRAVKQSRPNVDERFRRSTADPSIQETSFPPRIEPVARRGRIPPPVDDHAGAHKRFRTLCEELLAEVLKLDDYFDGDSLREDGIEVTLEIEHLLMELYKCGWGEGEYLKRAVVVLQSQINNAVWTRHHVLFLREAVRLLKVRYVIDESTVSDLKELVRSHGLDLFRGTISEPAVRKRYRIVEEELE